MSSQSPALKRYYTNRQNQIDAQKLRELQPGNLFNEKTFYPAFVKDLLAARKEVIIYSPFVTQYRSAFFKQVFTQLRKRNIPVFIFTRPIEEQEYSMKSEVTGALKELYELGVCVLHQPGFIHAKAAIIDREILWEGSMNILSQRQSREMMRRITDETSAKYVLTFLGLDQKLAEAYKFQYERLYRNLVSTIDQTVLRKKSIIFGVIIASLGLWLLISSKELILSLNGILELWQLFQLI